MMKRFLVPLIMALAMPGVASGRNFLATEFGAKGDGRMYCTQQLQRAIDKCAETGGGVVTFAPGRYLTGTLRLRSHVQLHLQRGAVIQGDTCARDKSAPVWTIESIGVSLDDEAVTND